MRNRPHPKRCLIVALLLFAACVPALSAERGDILVADFESDSYGQWKASGKAFGAGPAQGTLPNQMNVSGFEGKRLVNSYYEGDDSTGTLRSPAFAIERKHLNFLIGGGMHPGKACINLLVDGQVVRTATGPNDRPGGSESLDWHAWDVSELQGKPAVIEIVDQATGGWGHINIDQIVQSDRKRGAGPAARELRADKHYLHLPVKTGARKCQMRYVVGGKPAQEFEIELADGEPDVWVFSDLSPWKGQTLRVEVDRLPLGSKALDAIRQSDEVPDAGSMYREELRPQFHFTTRRGWINDPNGLVYYDGEYHLFYQHNPFGINWGNMTWGHAISRDLVHWTELPDALHMDELGTIFSGSAVVDHQDTAGFQSGPNKVIVCIYTSAGGTSRASQGQPFTQSIAYSNDRGRTWTKYARNPVLGHIAGGNRDPKVFWHEATKRWIMALYLDGQQYALFSSPDLKQWTRLSDLPDPGGSECPDFFELAVDGNPQNTRWVFWAGNGNYVIGRFDGKSFTKESGPHPSKFGANDYAAQTYSDIPASDGRRIQFSWMSGGKYPGMPFNQQMTVPRVLTLRTTSQGIRLCMEPVEELKQLRAQQHSRKDLVLSPGQNPLADLSSELMDIEAEIEPGDARVVGFEIRGQKVEYGVADRKLTALGQSAPLELLGGRIKLRILVDRTSVEVFANEGCVQMASCFVPNDRAPRLVAYSAGGTARLPALDVWTMRSAWPSGGDAGRTSAARR